MSTKALIQRVACLLGCASSILPSPLHALDKQGSAHGGQVAGPDEGVEIGGSLLLGSALYNPSYAARPDNTGLALVRAAGHMDIDLIGHRLSIPVDVNFFSNRNRRGIAKLAFTELDVISGLTSTWGLWQGTAIELGARYERDMPIDRGSYTQSYVDTRAKLMASAGGLSNALRDALGKSELTGAATLGAFAYNPTYAARPDNSGRALLRYALHVDWSMPSWYSAVYVDATFFTDRQESRVLRPSELDLTLGLAARVEAFELSVAYERDLPVDKGSYTQQMLFLYASWAFTLFSNQPRSD